jgi:hypothetical protein
MAVTAADFLPDRLSLSALREAAGGCKGCQLWELGTQTVFGEGAEDAVAMFVGEAPGDQEDKQGRPFVGPAGRLFDEALEVVGIDRSATYVTTPSSTSSGRRAGSAGSIRSRIGRRSQPAVPGSRPRSPSFDRGCSSYSAQPLRSRYSVESSA